MPDPAQSRNWTVTKSVSRVPLLGVDDLRLVSALPGMAGVCADYARVWWPRSTLARVL